MTTQHSDSTELRLTERQRQVLDLLAHGRTNPQIADALGISLPGAKWHVREVMNKLGAASRDEAVEIWRAHQRLSARMNRLVRGLFGFGLMKTAAFGIGTAATVASLGAVAAVGGYALNGAPGAAGEAVASPSPSAVFATATAEERARELTVEVMAPYSPMVVAPDDERAFPFQWVDGENGRSGHFSPGPQGRLLATLDYVVLDIRFVPGATSVETNVRGVDQALDEPRDVWVARLATHTSFDEALPTEADHLVVFADGSGELITGGMIGDLDPTAGGYRRATKLASFDAGAVTFWLYAYPPHFGHSVPEELAAGREVEVNPNEVCLGTVDSRMPSSTGGSCGVPNLDPGTNPMKVSVHNSQGFAHVSGIVTPNVARIRAVTEDGREVIIEPGPEVDGAPARGFIAAAPGAAWFVTIEALDADGAVLATRDFSDHPVN